MMKAKGPIYIITKCDTTHIALASNSTFRMNGLKRTAMPVIMGQAACYCDTPDTMHCAAFLRGSGVPVIMKGTTSHQ